MASELVVLIVMAGIFVASALLFKWPLGTGLFVAAIGGAVVAGQGVPLRHLLEGAFGYLDTILVIATAMILMRVLEENGALHEIGRMIVTHLAGRPALLLVTSMLFIMFPGMVTGSSSAGVLTTGAIIAPVLLRCGIPRLNVAAILSIGGILGMIAPPVNIPLMLIGGGVDMPYVGFTGPLLLYTMPIAVFTVLFMGYRYARKSDWERVKASYGTDQAQEGPVRFGLYLPLLVVVLLMGLQQLFPTTMPTLGNPLIFFIAALTGIVTGKRVNFFTVSKKAIALALPVMGILIGVGAFIQVMTLTGVRGYLVMGTLSLPETLLLAGVVVSLPLFGAVSSFGAASVLGVPFMLALLGRDEIIVGAALSGLAGLGDMMPPAALAGIFAAQVLGIDDYKKVLRRALIPTLSIALVGLLLIVFANPVATLFR